MVSQERTNLEMVDSCIRGRTAHTDSLTCAKDFLDEGYFLIIIQTAHNITSKRTEYKSKVIPILYNMSPAIVEAIKVKKCMHCTGEANIKNNIFYSLDDSTVFIDGGSEWCVELTNLVVGIPHPTDHNKQ